MTRDALERYSGTTMVLHWLAAVIIVTLLALGFIMTGLPDGNIELKFSLYQLHKSLGISLLALTLLRLGWHFMTPPPAPILSGWIARAANVLHWTLYALMILLPVAGWLIVSASPLQIPTEVFGMFELPHLPLFDSGANRIELEHLFEEIHESLAFLLIGLLVLHIGAALYHHTVARDATLARMMPGVKPKD